MPVAYPTAAESAFCNFFSVTPRLLCWYTGSVIPSISVQVLTTVGLSVLSVFWNPLDNLDDDVQLMPVVNVMGILLAFLLVFKTQSAYQQYWTALSSAEEMFNNYRALGMAACTRFDWEKGPSIQQYTRKIMRMIVVHAHVIVEYFRRTGANATTDKNMMDALRRDIGRLTGPHEFQVLYPSEDASIPGSESKHTCTHPDIIVFWIDNILGRCHQDGGILSHPHAAGLHNLTMALMDNFRMMNQIDKSQFPLPYAQLVKFLSILWLFTLPFVMELSSGEFVPVATFFIATAMFGLDEVAEILESPFGTDPNDIHLMNNIMDLINDLELFYYGRSMKMDCVFTDDHELCLRGISDDGKKSSMPSYTAAAERAAQAFKWTRSASSSSQASSSSKHEVMEDA